MQTIKSGNIISAQNIITVQYEQASVIRTDRQSKKNDKSPCNMEFFC